jgi:hypothetical protein
LTNISQTCVSTLTMRHLARGGGVLRELNDLRGPMGLVLDFFVHQREELERYKRRFGELPGSDSVASVDEEAESGRFREVNSRRASGLVGEAGTDSGSHTSSSS